MRVLAVGNMYPPHHLGGYEVLWQGAMRAARAAGHEVRVLTTDYRRDDAGPEQDSDVHRTLRWWWHEHDFPRRSLRERLALERDAHTQLAHHLRDLRPDLVTWWAMGGMPLSLLESVRRAGIPAVSVVIDDWLVYGLQVDQWGSIWSGLLRPLAPLAERVAGVPARVEPNAPGSMVFCSQCTRRRAAASGGWDASRSEVISPGVDASFLTASPPREWAWRLGYIGRIDERKGIRTAIEALARLPKEATLTVVGDGDRHEGEALRARAAELGVADRVIWTGKVAWERLPGAYAQADAILFPVRWEEPWGLVPLEAMGVGRPVIATGRGGSGEYLEHEGNALLFEADSAAQLAAAVRRLAAEPELRERLVAEGRRTAHRHTASEWEARLVEVMEQAVR